MIENIFAKSVFTEIVSRSVISINYLTYNGAILHVLEWFDRLPPESAAMNIPKYHILDFGKSYGFIGYIFTRSGITTRHAAGSYITPGCSRTGICDVNRPHVKAAAEQRRPKGVSGGFTLGGGGAQTTWSRAVKVSVLPGRDGRSSLMVI